MLSPLGVNSQNYPPLLSPAIQRQLAFLAPGKSFHLSFGNKLSGIFKHINNGSWYMWKQQGKCVSPVFYVWVWKAWDHKQRRAWAVFCSVIMLSEGVSPTSCCHQRPLNSPFLSPATGELTWLSLIINNIFLKQGSLHLGRRDGEGYWIQATEWHERTFYQIFRDYVHVTEWGLGEIPSLW